MVAEFAKTRAAGARRLGRCAAVLLGVACAATGAQGEVTAERLDAVIAEAVDQLLSQQEPNGGWKDASEPHDATVWAVVGLIHGQVDFEKPKPRKALERFVALDLPVTVQRAWRVMALCELYPRLSKKRRATVAEVIASDARWLVKLQGADGNWPNHADGSVPPYMSSNSRAVVALGRAADLLPNLRVPATTWKRAETKYLETRKADGGWNLDRPDDRDKPSWWDKTVWVVTGLHAIRDHLYPGAGAGCRGDHTVRRDLKINTVIDGTTDWILAKYGLLNNHGYGSGFQTAWQMPLQNLSLAAGHRYAREHDTLAEVVGRILASRGEGRKWPLVSQVGEELVILDLARRPVLLGKLRFEGIWNSHPRDAFHVARLMSSVRDRHLRWQVVGLDQPVAAWLEAPLLYISAETPLELTEEQAKKLRRYTDLGGTVLAEASCGNQRVARQWAKTCTQVWPEWPLEALATEHPLWAADVNMGRRRPAVSGIDDGVRTRVFFVRNGISHAWNSGSFDRGRTAFNLARNLLAYCTDCCALCGPFAQPPKGTGPKYAGQSVAPAQTELAVARVRHGKGWDIGRAYQPWEKLGRVVQSDTALKVRCRNPVTVGGEVPDGVDMLYLTGRGAADLGDGAGPWLHRAAGRDTFLFVEACLGDPAFDRSIRKHLEDAGFTLEPQAEGSALLTGSLGKASGFEVAEPATTRALCQERERAGGNAPLFYSILDGPKVVGVYSPYDLMISQTGVRAYGIRGYHVCDARALATNVLLLAGSR